MVSNRDILKGTFHLRDLDELSFCNESETMEFDLNQTSAETLQGLEDLMLEEEDGSTNSGSFKDTEKHTIQSITLKHPITRSLFEMDTMFYTFPFQMNH
jgi:hypothetical protein